MLIVLLCIILAIWLHNSFLAEDTDCISFKIVNLITFGFLGLLLGLLIAGSIGGFLPQYWKLTETTQFVSFYRESHEKNLYVSMNNYEDDANYSFYKKDIPDKYECTIMFIDKNNTQIFGEKRFKIGRMETYNKAFRNKWFQTIAINFGDPRYKFFVPEGTVQKKIYIE